MTIRRAELEDVGHLVQLYGMLLKFEHEFNEYHLFHDDMLPARGDIYKQLIANPVQGFILVDEQKGKIVGMLVAQYAPQEPGSPVKKAASIMDVVYLPELRKKGFGRQIFDKAIEICKRAKCDIMHLWISPENRFLDKKVEEDYSFRTVYHFKSLKL